MNTKPNQLLPALLAAAMLLGLAGCERPSSGRSTSDANPGAPVPTTPAGPVVRGNALVTGRVTLTGYAHSPRNFTVNCSGPQQHQIPDETVVLGPHNALANVVVYLKDAPNAGPTTLPPAVLDQVDCRYVPHVLAVQTGQAVQVKSSDATLHNVHTLSEANRGLNFGMNGKGSKELRFDRPETFRVKCDVHPWMSAHVAVFPHPYFAVTGPDGAFRLPNLPPGTYTLVAWHEKFDTLEQQITIDESKPLEVVFKYEPPAP